MHLLSELKIQFFFKYVGRLGNQQTDQIRLKTMDMIVLAINKLSLSRKKKEKKLLDLEYNLIVFKQSSSSPGVKNSPKICFDYPALLISYESNVFTSGQTAV